MPIFRGHVFLRHGDFECLQPLLDFFDLSGESIVRRFLLQHLIELVDERIDDSLLFCLILFQLENVVVK